MWKRLSHSLSFIAFQLLLLILIFSTFSPAWVICTQFGKSHPHIEELFLFSSSPDDIDFWLISANVMTKNKGEVLKERRCKLFYFSQTSCWESGMCFPTLQNVNGFLFIKLKTTRISHHPFTLVENKFHFLPQKWSLKFWRQYHQIATVCIYSDPDKRNRNMHYFWLWA